MTSGFFWIGNHVGIDFVNTAAADDDGRAVELLDTWTALSSWLHEAGLVDRSTRQRVPADERGGLLEWARTLRTAARAVLELPHDAAAGRQLNDVVGQLPVRLTYSPAAADDDFVTTSGVTDRVRLSLALAVLDATRLDRDRVRRCGRRGCVLLFFDTSKNGTRRWCDMAVCGNRAKAATHYLKQRS
jgi:predicted RNA-binding Zn ribbon-like protein